MQVSTPQLRLRQTRVSRLRPPFPSRRRQVPSWRLVGSVALPLALLGAVAYVARRRFFQGVVVFAEAVEEIADVVEDAAEDLAEAARERADGGEPAE